MTREQRKTIERYFYQYEALKVRRANCINEVAYATTTPEGERVKRSSGNATENAMIRALQEDLRLSNWCKVWENTLTKYHFSQKDKLMEQRYRHRERPDKTCEKLNIERRTYFYWVEEILLTALQWAEELKVM